MNDRNQNTKGLTRRDFIRIGSTGAAGIALADWSTLNVSAAGLSGKLPRRRYGRTGLEISALVGASDWSADVIPLAVEAGVKEFPVSLEARMCCTWQTVGPLSVPTA